MKRRRLKKKVKNTIFLLISICLGIGIFFCLSHLSKEPTFQFVVDWNGDSNDEFLYATLETYNEEILIEPNGNQISFDISDDENNTYILNLFSTSGEYTAKLYQNEQIVETYSSDELNGYVSEQIVHPESVQVDMPTYTLNEALDIYRQENYLLLFATIGDNTVGISQEEIELLQSMGFENTPADTSDVLTWIGLYQNQYAESYIREEVNSHQWVVSGHDEYVIAVPDEDAPIAFIYIDEEELSYCGTGLNLVVYDTENHSVVDSINWDFTTEEVTFNRHTDIFSSAIETTLSEAFFSQITTKQHYLYLQQQYHWMSISLLIGIIWLSMFVVHYHFLVEKPISKWMTILLYGFLTIMIIIGIVMRIGYQYLITQFEGVSVSQLLYHMQTNLEGTNVSGFIDVIRPALLAIIIIVVIAIVLVVLRRKLGEHKKHFYRQLFGFYVFDITIFIISISLILTTISQFIQKYEVIDWLSNQQTESSLFEIYYVDPSTAEITAPSEKKNLIYIYLESMEITDSSITYGGGTEENHIPELTTLALENDCFNGSETILSGAHVLQGTGWTIAGMAAQSAGIPLLTDTDQTSGTFLPGAYTIGEILKDNGYHNTLMIGSDASFGNRLAYFTGHGDYEICDYDWAKETGKIDQDYAVWWGYEDEKLFTFAKEKAEELALSDEPFNLTLLTADTHFPDGYLCEDCPDLFDEQYSNVFACSSNKVNEFVTWVSDQPWGSDTVIVLAGDHVGMDATHNAHLVDGYTRKTYVSIINSTKEEPAYVKEYATIDLYPTTLSALGFTIEGDRLGLGTDLYFDTQTLVEELSVEYLNNEIERTSAYYANNILK